MQFARYERYRLRRYEEVQRRTKSPLNRTGSDAAISSGVILSGSGASPFEEPSGVARARYSITSPSESYNTPDFSMYGWSRSRPDKTHLYSKTRRNHRTERNTFVCVTIEPNYSMLW